MRSAAIIILLVQACTVAMAQVQFTRVYGGGSYDYGAEVIQAPDDGYWVAGTSSSFDDDQSSQFMLIRTDDRGYAQWVKTYGSELADVAETMQQSPDGSLLIAGFSESHDNDYQVSAIKVTVDGDTIWSRRYGGPAWDLCKQAVALSDGGFALFGQTYSQGAGEGDFFLIRIDADGDTLWTRTYGGAAEESGESIALTNDGGFFLAGHTESFGAGGKDMYVVRADANGDTLWTDVIGGVEDDYCYAIAATADDGYVIAGGTYNNTPGKADFVVRKERGTLHPQWTEYELQPGDNFYYDVIVEPGTENVTVIGNVGIGINGGIDGRILRYGADGIWNGVARDQGSTEEDGLYDVKLTSDLGYVMVGKTQGFLERFEDVILIKGDNFAVAAPAELGIDEIIAADEVFKVRFAPNPVAAESNFLINGYETVMKYYDEPLILRIYDVIGQLHIEQQITSANQRVDTDGLSAGFHLYQLVSGNQVLATGKLLKVSR